MKLEALSQNKEGCLSQNRWEPLVRRSTPGTQPDRHADVQTITPVPDKGGAKVEARQSTGIERVNGLVPNRTATL